MPTDSERLLVSLEARVTQFEKSFQKANKTANDNFSRIEGRAKRSGDALEASMSRAASRANAQLSRIGVGVKPITLGVTLGGLSAAAMAKEGARLADNWTQAKNSLRVAGLEGDRLEQVLNSLFTAAQDNSTPLATLTDLYGKAALAQKALGASSDDLIKFSGGIATAIRASGTTSAAASGAITQLGQALGAGVVRAEEFNSILEGAPAIARAVAAGMDGIGGDIGKLRDKMLAGGVSSKDFFESFLKGLPVVQQMAAQALPTLEGSATRVTNALTRYVGQSDESLGATARLKAGLNALADNFDTTADVALKVAAVIAAALVGRAIGGMVAALAGAGVAIHRTIAALTLLRGAATLSGVAGAFAGLGAAAGPIGALLGAAAAAALYFATKGDNAAEAASRASANMTALGVSATSTADQISKVADELAKLSGAEIRVRIADNSALITQKYRELRDLQLPETQKVGRGKVLNPVLDDYQRVTALFTSGRMGLDQYRKELDRLANEAPQAAKSFAEAQRKAEDYTAALKTRAAQDQALAESLKRDDAPRGPSALDRGLSMGAAIPSPSASGAAALSEAAKSDDEKRLQKQTDDLVKSYEKAGGKITDAIRESFREIAKQVIATEDGAKAADKAFDGSAMGNAFDMIAKFEDFRPKPYWDRTALRTGYGSDTFTREDGTYSRVTADTVVTMADAARDLKRRIADFQTGIRGKIGADRFGEFGQQQQAALTSIAYNYGSLPDRIASVIKAGGTTEEIAKAIRGLGGDNGGINRDRRNKEADAFEGGATYQAKERDKASEFDTTSARTSGRTVEDINAETAALQRQAQATGVLGSAMFTFDAQAERERIIREELRKLADAEIEATPERIAAINQHADAQVAAAQRRADAERQVQRATENAQVRSQFVDLEKDAVKSVISDLRSGKSAAEAFANALDKIADRLIDMAIDALFAKNAMSGGGGGGFLSFLPKLFGFADGGYINGPGTGRSDSILARLSDGEYVVNAKATAEHRPVLEAINAGVVPKFADGGFVGRSGKRGLMGGSSATNVRMGDITINQTGSSGDAKKDAEHAARTADMVRNAVREEIADFYLSERRPGGMIAEDR